MFTLFEEIQEQNPDWKLKGVQGGGSRRLVPINVAEPPDVYDDRAKNVLSVSVHNDKAGEKSKMQQQEVS